MRVITDIEIKQIELDMMLYIHEICRKNNLRYFICGGTLIGAIRHNGFIPWDDDIDINMPYEDYKQLVDLINKDNRYKIFSISDDGYYYYFGKLIDKRTKLIENRLDVQIDDMGVYIDIFPLDGVPKEKKEAMCWYKEMHRYNVLLESFALWGQYKCSFFRYIYRNIKYFFYDIRFPYYRIKGIQSIKKKIEEKAHNYSFDQSDFVCSIGGAYNEKEIYLKKFFETAVQVKFEGYLLNAPVGYHEFLTQMYGDYMQMPPKEKQVSNHDFEAYWRDEE